MRNTIENLAITILAYVCGIITCYYLMIGTYKVSEPLIKQGIDKPTEVVNNNANVNVEKVKKSDRLVIDLKNTPVTTQTDDVSCVKNIDCDSLFNLMSVRDFRRWKKNNK